MQGRLPSADQWDLSSLRAAGRGAGQKSYAASRLGALRALRADAASGNLSTKIRSGNAVYPESELIHFLLWNSRVCIYEDFLFIFFPTKCHTGNGD